ncbi:MAG: hypothetical protein HY822_22540, partial [Acidobacteria bacterium]|nr:hypothetical protein [Acidobacteriota bacterium]
MKHQVLNRRQWTLLLGAAPLARARQQSAPTDELSQARERLRRAADEIRKVNLYPKVEPAFRFQ